MMPDVLKKYHSLYFLLILSIPLTVSGQDQRIDSLQQLLSKASHDTAVITLYHRMAEAVRDAQPERALAYEDSARVVAKKINDPERTAQTLVNIGALYRRQGDYTKAITFLDQALKIPEAVSCCHAEAYFELGHSLLRMTNLDSAMQILQRALSVVQRHPDDYIEGSIYNVMGNVAREQNRYERALDYYIRSVRIFEKIKSNAGLTQALSNVGNVHNLMGNTDKALEYAQESLDIAIAGHLKPSVAYTYRLLGRIYRKQGKPDDALSSYTKAVQLYREMGSQRDLCETLQSIGNIYFDKLNLGEAVNQYHASLSVARSIRDTLHMTYAYVSLGNALLELKKYEGAKAYLDSTLMLATKKKLATLQMDSYQLLSILNETKGNFKTSLQYYKRYTTIRDSLTLVQNRKDAQEIDARYQGEKKDNEIRILNAENELKAVQLRSKNNLRNYLVILLVFSLVMIFVLYNRYKIKLRANKKLRELDEMKSRFFTNVSHEFRTPLSLIIGPLQEKIRLAGKEEKDGLQLMHRNATRLQKLITQILDLSKIEAGSMELQLEEGDLYALLRFTGSTFSSFAERKSISFTLDIPDEVCKGYFDRDKLEKILYNLLSNAFKFTPEGGAVRMKAHTEGNDMIVEVTDSGIGIPSDKLGLIFTRFYRVDETVTRLSDGSGIGLALTRELTELHRGKLAVTSSEGIGSKFTVTFPFDRKSYNDVPVKTGSTSDAEKVYREDGAADFVTDTQPDGDENKPVIVVAEDNTDMQKFIRDMLHSQYQVITAGNGREALEKSRATIPDLVISDWMMPEMDGRRLCETLKTEEKTCHIPVLMLTAKADQPSKIEGLETGADDYLTKPFDTRELLVRISNLIGQRKRLRAIFGQEVTLQPAGIQLTSRDTLFMNKVHSLLEEKYADPGFGVEAFAETFSMSRMQLHRKLKALTDQSPGDLLRHFRLERAKQLLSVPGTQVSEVCFRVGFNNVANFSRAFKEHTGGTPSEFIAATTGKQ